ncbi:MAG TPA: Uma2 family endonuclease [Aggregatilineales bacterium]|nr:Uma2 family endonuclease [Aggregatilineales bacterium]
MALLEKLYTIEELWEIAHQNPNQRFELVEGIINEMSPVGGTHGNTVGELIVLIRTFVKQRKLGYVTTETGYILDENAEKPTVRAPDVAFISKDRLPEMPDEYIPMPPDLAVEVVSPGDAASDVHDKVWEYLNSGTQLVWVVYPKSKTVDVHTVKGSHTLTADDQLQGGAILPEFSVLVTDIFPS